MTIGSGARLPDPPSHPAAIDPFGVRVLLAGGARHRRGQLLGALFSGVWLLYLLQPVQAVLGQHHDAPYTAAVVASVGMFGAVYIAALVVGQRSASGARAGVAALFLLAVVGSAVLGAAGTGTFWIFVSVAAGLLIRAPRRAVRVIMAAAACCAVFSVAEHASMAGFMVAVLPPLAVGFLMTGVRSQINVTREVDAARDTVARLAAAEERLRIARDLHDLSGQSLSMITLKSELAVKLLRRLPASADRDRALAEVCDIGKVSRQTLHDTREAVSGYRQPTLSVEIITARAALELAGIAVQDDPYLTELSGRYDARAEAALAWCLREAVTNVIRHSGARNCRIGLSQRGGTVSLQVRDDGRGGSGDAAQAGTGLHGMSERLRAVGGKLELRPGANGFCLIATVPAREGATVAT